MQFLALDGNFRLKRKNVSSQKADLKLSKGWAYFIEETAYKDHLGSHKDERELVSFFYELPPNFHHLLTILLEKYVF